MTSPGIFGSLWAAARVHSCWILFCASVDDESTSVNVSANIQAIIYRSYTRIVGAKLSHSAMAKRIAVVVVVRWQVSFRLTRPKSHNTRLLSFTFSASRYTLDPISLNLALIAAMPSSMVPLTDIPTPAGSFSVAA
jgi:hypothetical protein